MKSKVASTVGMKKLVELLSSPDPAVQKGAAVALGHYAGQEENQQVLFSFSFLSFLLFIICYSHSTSWEW